MADAGDAFARPDLRRSAGVHVIVDTREVIDWAEIARVAGTKSGLVTARALNHTGAKVATVVQRQVAKQTGLTYAAVRKNVVKLRASQDTLAFQIIGRGQFLTLRSFGAVQRRAGVSARPWARRTIFRGTFIVQKLNGQVFRRDNSRMTTYHYRGRNGKEYEREGPRLVILYGPALPREMVQGLVPDLFRKGVAELLPARTFYELRRVLAKNAPTSIEPEPVAE